MRASSQFWRALLCTLLTSCATPSASLHEAHEPSEVVSSWEEGCEDERSLVLLCQEEGEECGLFRCREVAPREVLLASRGSGTFYIPSAHSFPRRWRGQPIGWPRATQPVLTFRFNRHFDPKPPPPALPPGRWVRHHLFAQEFREWFREHGVTNIHQFTLLIPEHVHLRIHSGGPRGGLWNAAWRQFQTQNPDATPAEIYRHAGELIFRFDLTGPLVSYYGGK